MDLPGIVGSPEAVAAETDDGSLSVAVGDSVDTADVEL